MCGICGFFTHGVDGYDQHTLTMMTRSLSHRGPDASGVFIKNGAGLGHARLSILDLSEAGSQPMTSSSGRYTISFNGEIYNYRELSILVRKKLRSTSDTEIVLELFEELGDKAIQKLNGMFAMVIYDALEHKIHLVRDRIGEKPLYYFHKDDKLAFASEIKALLKLPENFTTDIEAIADFLHHGFISSGKSIYKEIKQLPPGTHLIFDGRSLIEQKFWDISQQVLPENISNEQEAKETFNDLLISSVWNRMIADVPVGAFLSGGIDSSLICATAQELNNTPVKTFTVGFREGKFNEAPHARAIATYLKTDHHEFLLTEDEALEKLEHIIDHYDQPFADSSALPVALLSELAKKHVSVILSGDGGDELFMGYGAYTWAKRLNNPFVKAFRPIIHGLLSRYPSDRFKRAANLFEHTEDAYGHILSQEQYFFSRKEVAAMLIPNGSATGQRLTPPLQRALSPSEFQAYYDLQCYLPEDLLVKSDRASMMHGLELRLPLLDHRIIEFALNLSEKLKVNGNISKYLLKQVLYDKIPAHLIDRPKKGFSIPLTRWLKGELNYLIDRYLCKQAIEETGMLHSHLVNRYLQRFKAGEDHLYNRIWAMIVLQRWLINSKKTHAQKDPVHII